MKTVADFSKIFLDFKDLTSLAYLWTMPAMSSALIPEDKSSLISNILAIVGFIIVIVIVIWGVLYLTGLSKPLFSGFFRPLGSTIRVTVPTAPVSLNEPVTITWKYSPKVSGTYAFLYQCRPGFQFKAKAADNSLSTIPCGAAYSIGEANSFSVIPTAGTAPTTTIPISIVFVPAATSSPSVTGSASLSIKAAVETPPPAADIVVTPPPSDKKDVAKPPSKKAEFGLPDLSVRILSVGVIDPITGDIVPRPPSSPYDLVAVRFDIANTGTASTGPWYFSAQLPTVPPYMYSSVAQISLAPGDHIENMLRFRQAAPGGNFSVAVDGANLVLESIEANNFASQNI